MHQNIEATVYNLFVDYVAEKADWVHRRECAAAFDVHISTAMYHLEKAVQVGALIKIPGLIGHHPGWIYGLPDWQEYLFEEMLEEEPEYDLPF